MVKDNELRIEEWQPIAATESTPQWTGDLSEDCSAEWAGLCLRAEWMDGTDWWWSVSDMRTQIEIDSSNRHGERFMSGDAARDTTKRTARKLVMVE